MDAVEALRSTGFTLPSPAYLFGAFLFGIIGFAAYRYGSKASNPIVRWLGLALMVYPYFISQTWLLYMLGSGLCFAVYWYRRA